MRVPFAPLFLCVLLSVIALVSPASAGDYYSKGYYRNGYHGGGGYYRTGYYNGYYRPYRRSYGGGVWYSSSCCYKQITRHERRYVRVDSGLRYGYYGGSYRYGGYYGRPYYGGYYGAGPAYVGYVDNGYDSYNASYTQSCVSQRVSVPDGRGGWVWAVRQVCD
jgi:hypothetical protein